MHPSQQLVIQILCWQMLFQERISSHALTIHKCQGATLDFAIVDLPSCFCAGLLYVATSRVRNKKC